MNIKEEKSNYSGEEKICLLGEENICCTERVPNVSYGVIAANLYRREIDRILLEDCAGWMAEEWTTPMVGRRRMLDLINSLNRKLSPTEKREVKGEIGCFTKGSRIEVVKKLDSKEVWMLIYHAIPQLERIAQYKAGAPLPDDRMRLEDLAVMLKLGKFSRETCMRRLFGTYYDCTDFEEAASRILDLPCCTVDKRARTVSSGVRSNPSWENFVKYMRNTEVLHRICAKPEKANKP